MARHRCLHLLCAALALLLVGGEALAQAPGLCRVVATCGTATYTPGLNAIPTCDPTGNYCTNGSAGGGGSVTQGTSPWIVSGSGSAGMAATGVVTVQGIASMTPLLVTLGAETTKVIGTVNQGTSPWVTRFNTTPSIANGSGVVIAPSSESADGITPVVSASAEASHVLKASAGNVYSVSATNLTTTAGFLVLLNSTTAPGDGAITPLACAPLPASGAASISYGGVPAAFSTGITAVVTSAATCFTKTTGVITAFISGNVQ